MNKMSRQDAAGLLDNLVGMIEDNHGSDYDTALKIGIDALKEDVRSVRHGHWIIPRFGADAKCSECGMSFTDAYDIENHDKYCRHCGARMLGIEVKEWK